MQKKGFTLIEIMVSMSIFIIVMVVATGAVLSAVDANRKAQALGSVMNNLNVALESMVRDVRTGSLYTVGSNSIAFTDAEGNRVTYGLSNNVLQKTINTGSGVGGNITANEITIQEFNFTSNGNSLGDGLQPLILMQIKGYAGKGKTQSNFIIQTLLTQRLTQS